MKASVKATGEIVEVNECGQTFKEMGMDYMDTKGRCYKSGDLDFTDNTPFDYWTRLEHQAAIAVMQGVLNNSLLITSLLKVNKFHKDIVDEVTDTAIRYAHALVEKYKKEERK